MPNDPAGLIRAISGSAFVEFGSNRERRLAEPFVPLMAGDTVIVESGSVTIVDLRSNQEQRLGAGSKFVMPRSMAVSDASLYEKLVKTFREAFREPEQIAIGAARGGDPGLVVSPNGARFSPDAHINFQWKPTSILPAVFRLRGPKDGETPLEYRRENPPNPMLWPNDVRRIPGEYIWEILGRDYGAVLASARFEVLSETAAAEKRAHYERQAAGLFPTQRELGAELLAAKDGYFLR